MDLGELRKMAEYELTDHQQLALPVAKIYHYCAPCACLLATAIGICEEACQRAKTYFEFLIRPDDRLVSSCCSQKVRTQGPASLIEKLKTTESLPSVGNRLNLIDRLWVEQRLYEIEETDLRGPSSRIAETGGRVLSSRHSEGTAGIIILGELEYCLPIMRSPPFAWKPQISKETKII